MSESIPHWQVLDAVLTVLQNGPQSLQRLAELHGLEVSKLDALLQPFDQSGILMIDQNNPLLRRLSPHLELLEYESIEASIKRKTMEFTAIEVFRAIDSTNRYLMGKAEHSLGSRLCVADAQLQGRGRRGQTWSADPFANVTLSVARRLEAWPANVGAVALAVSVSIAQALNDAFDLGAQIKWPNDLMVDEAKLGGLLVEAAGQYGGECQLVVGLGLNVKQADWSQSSSMLPASGEGARSLLASGAQHSDYGWVSLQDRGVECDRNELVALLALTISEALAQFEREGFNGFRTDWQQLSCCHHQRVMHVGTNPLLVGQQLGVDEQGALLIRDDHQVIHVIHDVSSRIRPC